MNSNLAESLIGCSVRVKLRDVEEIYRGVLAHIDSGMHKGLRNLIIENGEDRPTILRGDAVVAISEFADCGYMENGNPHDKCRLDGAACKIRGDSEQCRKIVLVCVTIENEET